MREGEAGFGVVCILTLWMGERRRARRCAVNVGSGIWCGQKGRPAGDCVT